MQFVETHHTLQASFPIKVQVTIGGWMDGCWLPTAEHRQARERTTRLPSLLATYKAALAKCQPSTALFLRLSRRLAAWPVGGTVYECRVTNRPRDWAERNRLSLCVQFLLPALLPAAFLQHSCSIRGAAFEVHSCPSVQPCIPLPKPHIIVLWMRGWQVAVAGHLRHTMQPWVRSV